jgi:hypothetical protein
LILHEQVGFIPSFLGDICDVEVGDFGQPVHAAVEPDQGPMFSTGAHSSEISLSRSSIRPYSHRSGRYNRSMVAGLRDFNCRACPGLTFKKGTQSAIAAWSLLEQSWSLASHSRLKGSNTSFGGYFRLGPGRPLHCPPVPLSRRRACLL